MKKVILMILFFLCATSTYSEDGHVEDWHWKIPDWEKNAATVVSTTDEKGNTFGKICHEYGKASVSCMYFLIFQNTCRASESALYSALANADSSAEHIELKCMNVSINSSVKKNVFVVQDFNKIDRMVRKSNVIAFAFPYKNAIFKIYRFSLSGAISALDTMRAGIQKNRRCRVTHNQRVECSRRCDQNVLKGYEVLESCGKQCDKKYSTPDECRVKWKAKE